MKLLDREQVREALFSVWERFLVRDDGQEQGGPAETLNDVIVRIEEDEFDATPTAGQIFEAFKDCPEVRRVRVDMADGKFWIYDRQPETAS